MMNCIIVHGTLGCPDENWFLWAQTEIAKVLGCRKCDVITPHFPYVVGNEKNQGYGLWKSLMNVYKNAGLINEETILIGHSLGPVFIYRFLQETQTLVKAVISVSGKNNNWLNLKEFDNFNFDFYCNWDQLRDATKYAKYRYAFFGDNDPYIPLLNCKKFADATQSEEIMIKNGGHLNAAANYTTFPQLIDLIKKIISNDVNATPNHTKTFLDLEEPISESADLVCNAAYELCHNGIMDENCVWYHSVWQYLRLLNLVSTPAWHHTFYQTELAQAIKNKKTPKILISGTADYSMLAYVIDTCKRANCNAEITVLDTCQTPLFSCQWFAKRENVNIKCLQQNILKHDCGPYDIICSDAFLTRFTKKDAGRVANRWNSLLKKGGCVITTVRVHDHKTSTQNRERQIKEFIEKARERSVKVQEHIQYSPKKIAQMAEEYITRMKSSNLGTEEDILALFNQFLVKYNISNVLGELERSKYLQIVAKKK